MADIHQKYANILDLKKISELRESQEAELIRIDHWDRYRALIDQFSPPTIEELNIEDADTYGLTASQSYQQKHSEAIDGLIRSLIPWRKGPFSFLGHEIDAEWRSDIKWNRIAPHLPELRGRRIADIGANNGYYMFRMLKYEPELILGFDPSSRCFYQFDLFQRVLRDPRLGFELFGIEHMDLYPDFFDVVFCLGVIYHRRDPYTACRMLFDSMRSNGTLFLESLVYPGEEPLAFCPPGRYAKMRNVWYVPTVSCLMGWIEKAGFTDVEELATAPVLTTEQRKTELAPYESLADFPRSN